MAKPGHVRTGLKDGDTVVDIGCGTGLNFPLLHRVVGPNGTIIGVDLSETMLAQARHMAEAKDVLRRRPWEIVQRAMEDRFSDVTRRKFWYGFFYHASGVAPNLATEAVYQRVGVVPVGGGEDMLSWRRCGGGADGGLAVGGGGAVGAGNAV